MKLNVLPHYLPYGEENSTEIKIGVITPSSNETSSDIARIQLWRTKDAVYCSPFGEKIKLTSITSENEESMVEVIVPVIPKYLVIKGSYRFPVGGQYEYNTKSKYYEQMGRFSEYLIYHDHEDDIWKICDELFLRYKKYRDIIGLNPYRNTMKCSTVPSTGWHKMDEDSDSDLEDEQSLEIIPGPLMTNCHIIIATVREDILNAHPHIFGEYHVTNEWSCGFPVYANKYDKKLFNRVVWTVAAELDSEIIIELPMRDLCQAEEKIMYVYNGEIEFDINAISVFCSYHGTKL